MFSQFSPSERPMVFPRPRRYQQQIPSAATLETRKAQESATQQGLLAFVENYDYHNNIIYVYIYIYIHM